MNDNPFLSETFTGTWKQHFKPKESVYQFKGITNLKFYKTSVFPLYINLGRNMTKGISYSLLNTVKNELQGKVFLVYDIPSYNHLNEKSTSENIKLLQIKQYDGFLIKLDGYKDLTDYLQQTFSKSGRYKLKKYWKRLEVCFDIRYQMYLGEIEKTQYNELFDAFYSLLQKRFEEKQVYNNNLDLKEWNFYQEVVYPLILEKKASLFVIYNGNEPIGITLNFLSKDTFIDAITVFDIDYSKFHLGSINILKQIEWCLLNNFKVFDFSKGYFDYKTRWSNQSYNFNYHILYDQSSVIASIIAKCLTLFFKLKQHLRDIGINDKFHQIRYKSVRKNTPIKSSLEYQFIPFEKERDILLYQKLENPFTNSKIPKTLLFNFLYLYQVSHKLIEVSAINKKEGGFLIVAGDIKVLATPLDG